MDKTIIIITVILFAICISLLTFWSKRRKEISFLTKLVGQDRMKIFTFNKKSKAPLRILSNYRGYDIALGVDLSKNSKQVIVELFLATPTGVKMEIRDPKSLTYRKNNNRDGVWLGEYKEPPSKLELAYFDSLIDRIKL